MSACSMVSGFVAKLMANSRSRIAHWQCTKTQKVRDGRPLLGAQRTRRRLLRRLGHGLPPTILDERLHGKPVRFPLTSNRWTYRADRARRGWGTAAYCGADHA